MAGPCPDLSPGGHSEAAEEGGVADQDGKGYAYWFDRESLVEDCSCWQRSEPSVADLLRQGRCEGMGR